MKFMKCYKRYEKKYPWRHCEPDESGCGNLIGRNNEIASVVNMKEYSQ
ncbi:hypothetical protein KAW96_02215 [candidate division WOR-3 bacterium]|nr:hypothetical protein [candidate division WOR-3 bacterium]